MSKHNFNRVRELKNKGLNKTQIANELDFNWKTVSKYYDSNTPPKFQGKEPRGGKPRLILPFTDRILSLIETIPDIHAIEAFERIKQEGYLGSLRSVQRVFATQKAQKPKERFFEQVYEPGEQVQFDFKEKVELMFLDGPRLIYLHYGTFPYSSGTRVKAYAFQNYECFIDGIHSFFQEFGGLTKNIRIDNLSPCVKKILKGRQRLWTKAFEEAIEYYGFGVLPCNPGKGNEKGHVERDIQTYTHRITIRAQLEGVIFKDFEHLNEWLLQFMREEQTYLNEKIQEEVKCLAPLPERNDDILCKTEERTSTSYGTVSFNNSSYSVPDFAIGRYCLIVLDAYQVRIFSRSDRSKAIAVHPRKKEGEHSILMEHVLPSLIRKPQAMIRWAHRKILFPNPIFEKYYKYLLKLDKHSAEREFLLTLNLILNADFSEVMMAIELVLQSQSVKPFNHTKELLFIKSIPSVVNSTAVANQTPLKPDLSVYDKLIP